MKLATLGINIDNLNDKYGLLRELHNKTLYNDSSWFFALHPGGMTLRTSLNKVDKVIKILKAKKLKYKKDRHYYIPYKHEYYGVHIMGDDIVPLLHSMSVIYVKHSPHFSFHVALERFNHMFVNMRGQHDFYQEALIYLRLAEGRADMIKRQLPLPKFMYKLYLKLRKYI